jgi:excisionase family DNA binding protein
VGRTFTYSLIKSGQLPSYRVGRLLRVRRRDVDRWLEHNKCVLR